MTNVQTAIKERVARAKAQAKAQAQKEKTAANKEKRRLAKLELDAAKAAPQASATTVPPLESSMSAMFMLKLDEKFELSTVTLESLSEESFSSPFILSEATPISDLLDSAEMAGLRSKITGFAKKFPEAPIVKQKGRAQSRPTGCEKIEEALLEIASGAKPFDKDAMDESLRGYRQVALYGISMGKKFFGPDYCFLPSLRYQLEGSKYIVMMKLSAYLRQA